MAVVVADVAEVEVGPFVDGVELELELADDALFVWFTTAFEFELDDDEDEFSSGVALTFIVLRNFTFSKTFKLKP